MKSAKTLPFFLIASLAIAGRLTAGPEPIPGDSKVVLPTENEQPLERIRPWFGAEITYNDPLGVDQDLLTLEDFIPWFQDQRNLFFTFGRLVLSHNTDDDSTILANNQTVTTDSTCPECNPIPLDSIFRNHDIFRQRDDVLLSGSDGIGYRYYSPGMDRIFGANAFYDYRDTGQKQFSQVGLGVETLGHWVDFRANGYIVVGDDAHVLGNRVDPVFFKDHIDLEHTFFFEHALSGADSEVGVPIIRNWGLKGYVGGYYYTGTGEGDGFVGVKGRLEERVTDDLDFGVTVAHDDKFGTTASFSVAFRFGPGSSARKGAARDVIPARRADRIQRNQQIVVRDGVEVRHALAIDPTTGTPIDVIHVDSNAPAGGNGTVDHPYMTLAQAQAGSDPNDIIFAHGSSVFNGQSIVLQDSQRFLGEGVIHLFESTHGIFILPGRIGVPRPEIFGPDNTTVVTLANDNEVRNFFIQAADGTAAAPNGSTGISAVNVTGALIRDVTVIAGNGANGAAGVNGGNGGIAIVVNGSTLTLCDSDVTGGNGGSGGNVSGLSVTGPAGGSGGAGGDSTGSGGVFVGGAGGSGGGGADATGGNGTGANGGLGGDAVNVTGSVFVASNVIFNGGNGGAAGRGTGGDGIGGNGGDGGAGGNATDTIDSTNLITIFGSALTGGDGGNGAGGGSGTGGDGVGGIGGAGGAALRLAGSNATFCDAIVLNGGNGGAGGIGVGGAGFGGVGGSGGKGGDATARYTVTVTISSVGLVIFAVNDQSVIIGGLGGAAAGGGGGFGGAGTGGVGGVGGAGLASTGSIIDSTMATVTSTGGAGGVGGAGVGGAAIGGSGGIGGAGGQVSQSLTINTDIMTAFLADTETIVIGPLVIHGGDQGVGAGGGVAFGGGGVGGDGGAGGAGVHDVGSVISFASNAVFGGAGGTGGTATGGSGSGGDGGSASASAGNALNDVTINLTDIFFIVPGTTTITDGPVVLVAGGAGGAGAAGGSGNAGSALGGVGGVGGSGLEMTGSLVSATSISATGGNGGDSGAATGGLGVGGRGGSGGQGGRADTVIVEVPTLNFGFATDSRTNTSGHLVVGNLGGGGGPGGDGHGGAAVSLAGGAGGAAVASAGSVVTFGDAALTGGSGGAGGVVRAGNAIGGDGGDGGAGGNARSRFREDLNASLSSASLSIIDSFAEVVLGGNGAGGSAGGTAFGGPAGPSDGGAGGAALLATGSVVDFTGSAIALTGGNGGAGGDSFAGSAQGGNGGNGGNGGDATRIQRLSYNATVSTFPFTVTETDSSVIVGGNGAGGGSGGTGFGGPSTGGAGGSGGTGIDATGSVVTLAASTLTGGNGGNGGNATAGDALGGNGGNGGDGGTATFDAIITYNVVTIGGLVLTSDSDLPTVAGGNGAAGGGGGTSFGGPATGGAGGAGGIGISSNASLVTLTDSAIFGGMGGDAGTGNGGDAIGGDGGNGGAGGRVVTSFVVNSSPGLTNFAPFIAFGNGAPGGVGADAFGGPATGGAGGDGGDASVSIAGGLIVLNGTSSTTGGDAGNGGDGNGGDAFAGNGGNGGDGNGGGPGPGALGGTAFGGPATAGPGGTGGVPGGSNGSAGVGTDGTAIVGNPGNTGGP